MNQYCHQHLNFDWMNFDWMKPLGVPTPGSLSGCRLWGACCRRWGVWGACGRRRRDPRRFLLSLFSPFPPLDKGFPPSVVLSFSLLYVESFLLSLLFAIPTPLTFSSSLFSPFSPKLPQRRMRRRKEIPNPFITRSSESSWGSRIPPKSSADREKGLRSFSSPRHPGLLPWDSISAAGLCSLKKIKQMNLKL